MNKQKSFGSVLLMILLIVSIFAWAPAALADGQSQFASGTTNANMVFGPGDGQKVITAVSGKSNADGAAIKVYASGGSGKWQPFVGTTNTSVTINLGTNTSNAITTGDIVCVVFSNKAVLASRVTGNSTDTFTLAKALTQGLTTNDFVYELVQDFQWDLTANTGFSAGGYDLYYSPSDSPIYIEGLGTGSVNNAATVRQ